MNFIQSLLNQTTTANGAVSHKSSLNKPLDLFSMGVSCTIEQKEQLILEALTVDPIQTIKVVCYLRDCRGGQGNKDSLRLLNKIVLSKLSTYEEFLAGYFQLLPYIPQIGSWKDVYQLYGKHTALDALILEFVHQNYQNGLCAKWFPRQSQFHKDFAKYSGCTIGEVRRTIAANTKVVETAMCSGNWHEIKYESVPSVAFKKYTRAFKKNDSSRFEAFLNKAVAGEVKVNASVLYPHDLVSKLAIGYYSKPSATEVKAANAQWANLPNYMTTPMNILPIIDVSGSMTCQVPGTSVKAIDIALGLGLYFAEHNHGAYKDVWLNFSNKPKVQKLKGSTVSERIDNMNTTDWDMSTNLQAVFDLILSTSKSAPADTPKVLLIVSDMEFNCCGQMTNFDTAKAKFAAAGLELPLVIFWRVNVATGQQPVTMHSTGSMLINGYSPAIMKLICEMNQAELANITPYNMMLKAIEKYNYVDSFFTPEQG